MEYRLPKLIRTNRRECLKSMGAGALLAGVNWSREILAEEEQASLPAHRQGRAKNCIFVWLGGGACHIDTFDPKQRGDAKQGAKQPGSYYDPIDTAIPGVQVCEHLPEIARRLDQGVLIRSLHHEVIDEHAAATNRLHVGRPPTGTTLYPSIGSVVAQQLGAEGEGIPPYVVMGYPSSTRGPGFLGARHGYIYLTDTEAGPAGLRRPLDVDASRRDRRNQLLERQISRLRQQPGASSAVAEYSQAAEQAMRLSGPDFMPVFDLASEDADLRVRYGDEFGQRCLLARRLIQSGVRFVEVSFNLNFINGTGWDTHNEGQLNQHVLIQQLDRGLATLLDDLRRVDRLDDTLVVVATEFGRPPEFDGGGGRGHHSKAFSVALFGGGLRSGTVIGQTDDFGREIVSEAVSVPDFHATIYASLGINPAHELYDGERPVPITDQGKPIGRLFAG